MIVTRDLGSFLAIKSRSSEVSDQYYRRNTKHHHYIDNKFAAGVTLILFTETHVTMPVSLSHASMIHHEEVDLKTVSAGPLDLVMLCSNELNHLHTTALTWSCWRHRAL